MIKIEIATANIIEQTISYKDKKTGAPAEFLKRHQVGYAHIPNEDGSFEPHPAKIEIALEAKQPAFAPGNYQLLPASMYVNGRGRLEIGRLRLAKLGVSATKAAA